jgi:hypothetical protein
MTIVVNQTPVTADREAASIIANLQDLATTVSRTCVDSVGNLITESGQCDLASRATAGKRMTVDRMEYLLAV